MKIIINGVDREFTSVSNISELLASLGLKTDRVAVEVNRELVSRNRWDETRLAEGDKVEIVQFVGGGNLSEKRLSPPGHRDTEK